MNEEDIVLHRSKRYLYAANKTCGHIPFCSKDIHDRDLIISTALADDSRCSKFAVVAVLIFDIILSLAIIFSNVAIILIIRRSKVLNNFQGIFKTNMAVCDLITGLLVIPGFIYNLIRFMLIPLQQSYIDALFAYDDDVANQIFGAALTIAFTGSLLGLFLLSMDRYFAVTRPFSYEKGSIITRPRAYAMVGLTWIVSIFLSIVPFGDPTNFHYTVDYMTMAFMLEIKLSPVQGNYYHGLFFSFIVFVVPYLGVVIITLTTWIILLRDRGGCNSTGTTTGTRTKISQSSRDSMSIESDKGINSNAKKKTSGGQSASKEKKMSNSDLHTKRRSSATNINQEMIKITRTIFLIVLTCSICVLPFLLAQFVNLTATLDELKNIKKYGENNTVTPHTCHPVMYLAFLQLMFVNSFSNFIIYNLRNERFRREFLKYVRWRKTWSPTKSPSSHSLSTTSNVGSRRTSTISLGIRNAVRLDIVEEIAEEDTMEVTENDGPK